MVVDLSSLLPETWLRCVAGAVDNLASEGTRRVGPVVPDEMMAAGGQTMGQISSFRGTPKA